MNQEKKISPQTKDKIEQGFILLFGIVCSLGIVLWSLNQEAERVKNELDRRENLTTKIYDDENR